MPGHFYVGTVRWWWRFVYRLATDRYIWMSYDWPPGWNETRTAKAIQSYVCERLSVPKKSVRCSVEGDGQMPKRHVGTVVQIFCPLGAKPTKAVHEVFARLEPFAEHSLIVEVPEEKLRDHTYTVRPIYVWSPDE